jgi:Domain of unknown function (DUF4936)
MQCWYVYYRLPARDTLLMVDAARAMIDRVQTATGVSGRLLRKFGENDGTTTLMEVYEGIIDVPRFERALAHALATSGLTAGQIDSRRVERFEDA